MAPDLDDVLERLDQLDDHMRDLRGDLATIVAVLREAGLWIEEDDYGSRPDAT